MAHSLIGGAELLNQDLIEQRLGEASIAPPR